MNEASCKGIFVKKLKAEGLVVFRHEDHFTSGHPDLSVTGSQRTIWIEVKFGDDFKTRGIQKLTMQRLETAGIAFYLVFWYNVKLGKRTYIVRPSEIDSPVETWEEFQEGFAYDWVVERVKKVLRNGCHSFGT